MGSRTGRVARSRPSTVHAEESLSGGGVEHIARALELRDPRKLRNRAFDAIGLGRAYLVMGEPEQACRVTDPALGLAARIGSGRVNAKLDDFLRESGAYGKVRAVADFRAKVRHQLQSAVL